MSTQEAPADIVERLRGRMTATRWSRGLDLDYATAWEPDALCAEAADEITRLRAALSERAAPTDFQLEQLFDAAHEHGEFGRGFRERARQILAAHPAAAPESAERRGGA